MSRRDPKQATEDSASIVERLVDKLPISMGYEEDDHPYNGPFSTTVEWHAFLFGVLMGMGWAVYPEFRVYIAGLAAGAFGLSRLAEKDTPIPQRFVSQVHAEPHYFTGGVLVGMYVAGGELDRALDVVADYV